LNKIIKNKHKYVATQNVYNKMDCATKILPSVVPLLIDSDK